MSRSVDRDGSCAGRRGIALAAVLVVGLGILLIVVGTLHFVRAGVASMGGIDEAIQNRLTARSAVRALAADLFAQRSSMLQGLVPQLPSSYELFDLPGGDGGRIAVVRVLPLGPGGARVGSEAAKLDLNRATAAELTATGLLSASEAATIVAARNSRPGGRFEHLSDLLALEGDAALSPTRILGPPEEIAILSRVDEDEEDLGERISLRLDADLRAGVDARPLVDVLTVHAFEPDLRIDGTSRFLLPGPGESVDLEGLGPETGRYVEAWLGSGEESEDDRSGDQEASESDAGVDRESSATPDPNEFVRTIWKIANRNGGDAGIALDALTWTDGGWRNGLLDVNLASQEALLGIEGMDETMAAAVVARRDAVPEDRRFDRFWPIGEGVVDAEAWLAVVPRITTRSLVWRATFAVGSVPADDPEAALSSPIAWEVVVDCGGDRPRLVEIRDVTMLELVVRMLAETEESRPEPEIPGDRPPGEESDGFDGEPLFDQGPLFAEESLFDDAPLFPESSPFDEGSIFGERPLFPGSPTFGNPDSDPPGTGSGSDAGTGSTRSRDRGPGGRWRPPSFSG
ncbi:MAG: hypothetical protein VX672_05980 [Planctomycetota bacterium]|nr:hypothetical protein [Planctomycetota bacterium]